MSLLSLPKLEALIKIEATLFINSKGKCVSLSFDEFYKLVKTHEWAGSFSKSKGDGDDDDAIPTSATLQTTAPSIVEKLSKQVEEWTQQFSEEERLLFQLMAVTSWKSNAMTTKSYPLFQLTKKGDNISKYLLEMCLPPESVTLAVSSPNSVSPTKAKANILSVARSEVLRNMYKHSKKYATLDSNSSNDLQIWWENAYNVSQMILDHRKLNAKKMTSKTESLEATRNTQSEAIINNNIAIEETTDGKKMTLEERVRAKSQLRNKKATTTSSVDKTLQSAATSQQNEQKALLELADALRAYSSRRTAVGSGSNVSRLSVSDFMKDAIVAWNGIVHNASVEKNGGGGGAGGKTVEKSRAVATPVTNIDLSRVLFHLRIKMACSGMQGDGSSRRQMEHYVLESLQKLATSIPNWIHLRSLPSSLSATTKETKPKKPDAPPATQQSSTMDRKTMRSAIIVIRNDGVDYAKDVRAKLGGRSYHQSNSLDRGGKSGNTVNKKKRSLKEFMGKQNAATDAIVPPSFRKRYDKMLKE